MIPVRLFVRNFMCYRGEGETLDLEPIHLACLAGENGAGKSALLSAITWALWGKARERISDDDQIMSLGATDMEVEFEFILGEGRYRVIRKRVRKGTKSFPTLELHMRTDEESDTWKPLTGHSVPDTETRINKLLKMDYETFINSAFILQGRADSFTVKNPSERKEVLGKILGLEQYDRLEEQAKEEARERKSLMIDLDATIKRIEGDLMMRATYQSKLDEVEAELKTQKEAQASVKQDLKDLRLDLENLKGSKQRADELATRIESRKAQITEAQAHIVARGVDRDDYRALVDRGEEIRDGYSRLISARDRGQKLREKIDVLSDLEKKVEALKGEIKSKRSGLESEERMLEGLIRQSEMKLSGRAEAERQLSENLIRLRDLERLQEIHEDSKCQKEALDLRIRSLTEEKQNCEKEGKSLRQKLDLLVDAHAGGKGHAGCPLCGTGLSEEALKRVQDSFEADITARRADYDRTRKELEQVNKEFVAISIRIDKEREQLKQLPVVQDRKAQYHQKLLQMDQEQENLADRKVKLAEVRQRLKMEQYAEAERAQLAEVEAQVEQLSGVREEYDAAQALEVELTPYNEEYHKLQNAEALLPKLTEQIEAEMARLAAWCKDQEHDEAERERLLPLIGKLQEVEDRVAEKETLEREADKIVHELVGQRGELKNDIERCDKLQVERNKLFAEHKKAEEEKRIYDELASAFGKKGIQAMIIENVIPEIEEEANGLLGRMTDGRMTVQFATQRDAKSTKSVIETLDINISDEMGTRPYELYSGGEAYRVNFAVRIALSKLLARRAGAQLQMLVIDEGFGTQDGNGREKLVGAIRSIQDDFEKILVVTHIEELKGEFPVRIDVEKKDTGSKITVN
jgi:DNA repair protein SbcC/Rad50